MHPPDKYHQPAQSISSVGDPKGWMVKILHSRITLNIILALIQSTRNDPWAQDETEFGYSQIPVAEQAGNKSGCLDIVLNSPRNRGLDVFPIYELFGTGNTGYITRGGTGEKSSMDSFGNLEVTPPVDGYPLGRIYYGGCMPGTEGRKMMSAMRDFLDCQGVQKPLELYTDWLVVGHVDEMMSFVPAEDPEGNKFKLLLASPRKFYIMLESLKQKGYGDKVFFKGRRNIHGAEMEKTVEQLLAMVDFQYANYKCQEHIDYNRELLMKELNLKDEDIIDIPALYYSDPQSGYKKVSAYMPGMVNLTVWDKKLLIPKPFGAVIDGKCCMEEEVRHLLEPLKLECCFIDDWDAYHISDGEVHCGTNILRKPNSHNWWECTPKL